jgi:hypothetical protein
MGLMMKRAMKNTSMLLLIFMVVFASSIYSSENDWGVEIELDKKSYVLHEPIWLDVTITNNTSDTLRTHGLSAPNHYGFTIDIYDEEGGRVKYTGSVGSSVGGPGQLLCRAGEQSYNSYELTRDFASRDESSGYGVFIDYFPFIPKGAYTVQVIFEDVASNVLTFEIVKPTGDEDVALHFIEDAFKVLVGHQPSDLDQMDLSSQKYAQVVEQFPNSVFAETCYWLSRSYSREVWNGLRQGTFDKMILTREMLDKYPNSGQSGSWLVAISYRIDDGSEVDLLSTVIQDKPDTRAAKYAKLMLSRMANQKAGE